MLGTDWASLKPSQLATALESLIPTKQPIAIWGAPGLGKSAIVRQTSEVLGMALKDVRAVLLDPVDLRGLPHVNGDNRAHWAIPEFLPQSGKGILFLDELNRAPMLVQNACFQLVLDRQLGEYRLPDDWVVIAACNRETDGGGVTKMPSALSNRFVHFQLESDLDDWTKWAAGADITPMVMAFLRWRPELLHKFDAKETAFPTPRSWAFVNTIIRANMPATLELATVQGAVGHAAAIEFEAFTRTYRSLPNIDAIMENPASFKPNPQEVAVMYAVSAAVASRANPKNVNKVLGVLERLPTEYQVAGVRDMLNRDSATGQTPEFIRWAMANASIMS